MQEELIIAGAGGQGILFAGELLAHAAMEAGKYVTFFPSYGAEIRGGSANCTVVISDEEIGSPVVTHPSSLIVLNNLSLGRFLPQVKKKGLFIVNSSLVNSKITRNDIEILEIPANEIAEKKVGSLRTVNLVALGFYLKKREIVPLESVGKALEKILKEKKELLSLNKKALEYGYTYQEASHQ